MERRDLDSAQVAPPDRARSATGPPAIELRHLRYFLMVSEELHFRRAAERLFMAQPPLSQAIRRLEEELGVQLLARTSRAVALTEAGRAFAEHARKVVASLDLAVAEARRAGGGGSTLQIGFAPYLPIDLVVRFLDALHECEPGVRPQVKQLLAFEQIARLHSGELDLGIFPSDGSEPKLQTELLVAGEPLTAFLRPDHPLAEKAMLGPQDLAEETLITVQPAVNPRFVAWLGALERIGYRFGGLHEVGSNTRDWILAVAEGAGVMLLPGSALEIGDARTIVVLRPLDPPLLMPDTVVAWPTRPPTQLRALTDEISELTRALRATMSSASTR
jgi:DNA-binding transcriptional LysR family regulator